MNIELLDSKNHKDLRVETNYFPGLGYDIGAVMILPNEILEAQREYPIVFRKHHESGEFFLNALVGFEPNQNLFIGSDGNWNAEYVPLAVAKGPFMIGMKKEAESKEERPVLSIIRDDPRVGLENGEALFKESGEPSPYLERVNSALAGMHSGMPMLKPFIDSLLANDLIEPLNLNATFNDGATCDMTGVYTVPEERLSALSEQQLVALNKDSYLSLAYYISGSLTNVYKLTRLRNNLV